MTYRSIWRRRSVEFSRALRAVRLRPDDVDAVHDARVAGRRLLAVAAAWNGTRPEAISNLVKRLGRARNLDVAISHARKRGAPRPLLRDLERRRAKCELRIRPVRLAIRAADRRPAAADLEPLRNRVRTASDLHEVRRAVRMLRYASEILPRPRHLRLLRELQDEAGLCRDLEILARHARHHRKFRRALRAEAREAERRFRRLLRRLP